MSRRPVQRRVPRALVWPVVASLALAFFVVACQTQPAAGPGGGGESATPAPVAGGRPDVIKIISSLPRTGSANAQTTTIVNGIRMAIDEVGGQVGNFKIEYEDWDDASAKKGDWDPEVEAANADRASKDPDILFYIGTYNSGAAKIAMPIVNRANLTMISPGNTYPGLTKPGLGEPNEPDVYRPSGKVSYFRVVPADDLQGKVGAEWVQQMGGKKVYVLDDRSLYGKGVADVFHRTAEEIGLTLLGREGLDPKAQEYRSLMTKIKQLGPDFVYFGGTTQTNAGQLAKDMLAVGLDAKFMVPDGCFENAFIQAAGPQIVENRAFITFGGVPADKLTGKGAEFFKRYVAKYGGEPQAYAVYGYVAAQVALDAIAKAGVKDREAVRLAVTQTQQVDGALGTWSFDANGDTTMTRMSGNTVRAGKFEFVTLLGEKKEEKSAAAGTVGAAGGGPWAGIGQQAIIGLTNGMIFALIALGYTMVYGVLEFINFAHGDLFMLASFFALTLIGFLGLGDAGPVWLVGGLALVVVASGLFAGALNAGVDRFVYRPLRHAPKLAPLVSAIGMSFVFQNLGLFWGGLPLAVMGDGKAAAAPKAFPDLVSGANLLGPDAVLRVTAKDLLVIVSSLVLMAALYAFVKYSRLGKGMRAVAQDPAAARLMGVHVDGVIRATFFLGGLLAGFAAVIYGLYINTIHYQIGYQNGLYAFTAAVVSGIGNIPGAVLGGLIIGLVRSFSDQWIGAQWQQAVVFGLLIVLLVFRPSGLLGGTSREKV